MRTRKRFERPSPRAREAWRRTVTAMLRGKCESLELADALDGYKLQRFSDRASGRSLCLLRESSGSKLGWGTFVTDPRATGPLHVLAPHPVFDEHTGAQAARIFSGTRARSALIAGAERHAGTPGGGCGTRPASDPTHSPHTMFQPTVAALDEVAPHELILQLHGMATSSCGNVDVYLTHGSADPAPDAGVLAAIRDHMADSRPDWTVAVPGEDAQCRLHGSKNVQGRLLAGVDRSRICEHPAPKPDPRFIHVEQKPWVRRSRVWTEVLPSALASRKRPSAEEGSRSVARARNSAPPARR